MMGPSRGDPGGCRLVRHAPGGIGQHHLDTLIRGEGGRRAVKAAGAEGAVRTQKDEIETCVRFRGDACALDTASPALQIVIGLAVRSIHAIPGGEGGGTVPWSIGGCGRGTDVGADAPPSGASPVDYGHSAAFRFGQGHVQSAGQMSCGLAEGLPAG